MEFKVLRLNDNFKTIRSVVACYALSVLTILSTAPGFAFETGKKEIVVYYFHGTIRCPSCLLLEELTRDAVEFRFDGELESGELKLAIVNVDEEENEHFVEHYNLAVQSIVVSRMENGIEKQWKKLDKAWSFLHDEGRIFEYIQVEILDFLN